MPDFAPFIEMNTIIKVAVFVWVIMYVVQFFLAFGTAYRCTKKGNNNGFGLFVYLIGFWLAALVPGLGLHYYIKHLHPKVIIQPQVVKIVDTAKQNKE